MAGDRYKPHWLSQSEREETSGYETFRENDDEDAVSYLGK
jgi:hypothetical protein